MTPISSPNKIYRVRGDKGKGKNMGKSKDLFGALYKTRRLYQINMKAHRSSFETANTFTKNPHHGSE